MTLLAEVIAGLPFDPSILDGVLAGTAPGVTEQLTPRVVGMLAAPEVQFSAEGTGFIAAPGPIGETGDTGVRGGPGETGPRGAPGLDGRDSNEYLQNNGATILLDGGNF